MTAKELYDYMNDIQNEIPAQLKVTGVSRSTILQILAVLMMVEASDE